MTRYVPEAMVAIAARYDARSLFLDGDTMAKVLDIKLSRAMMAWDKRSISLLYRKFRPAAEER